MAAGVMGGIDARAAAVFLGVVLAAAGARATGTVERAWDRIDAFQAAASGWISASSETMDRRIDGMITRDAAKGESAIARFRDDRLPAVESGESRIDLCPELTLREGDTPDLRLRFNGRLDLPRLERRAHLLFQNVPDEDTAPLEVVRQRSATVEEEDRRSAALRFELLRRMRFSSDLDVGLNFKPEPVPKVKVRGRAERPLGGPWRLRGSESVFWESDDGFGERTVLQTIRPLGDRREFRASSAALWREEHSGLALAQELSYAVLLSRGRALNYRAAVEMDTAPAWTVSRYLLRVLYRAAIHDDWIYLELEPGVDFPEDRDYRTCPLIAAALEFRFGHTD